MRYFARLAALWLEAWLFPYAMENYRLRHSLMGLVPRQVKPAPSMRMRHEERLLNVACRRRMPFVIAHRARHVYAMQEDGAAADIIVIAVIR